MSNFTMAALAWTGLLLHVIVGFAAIRSPGSRVLVPALNLLTGACVLAYWANRWFGYLFRGITWYLSDQVIPLYALFVCIVAGVAIAGRSPAAALNWLAFVLDALVFVAAVLFVTFFRMNRLF